MSAPTIIPSEYGLGEIAPLPDRPVPPQPKAERLERAGVQKLFQWTDAQLDRALESPLGFPAPVGRRTDFLSRTTLVWASDAVLAWRERIVTEVEALGLVPTPKKERR